MLTDVLLAVSTFLSILAASNSGEVTIDRNGACCFVGDVQVIVKRVPGLLAHDIRRIENIDEKDICCSELLLGKGVSSRKVDQKKKQLLRNILR